MINIQHITQIEKLVPLGNKQLQANEVRVFLWQHTLTAQQLLQLATTQHIPLIHHYENLPEKRRVEKLSIQLLINQLFNAFTPIHKQESGKPYLPHKKLEISISHTQHVYALSLSPQPHGIDVEQRSNKAQKVAQMFTTSQETAPFLAPPLYTSIKQADLYTTLWSCKEAIYKHQNTHDLSFRNHIHLHPLTNTLIQAILTHPHLAQSPNCEVFCKQYPTFILTLSAHTSIICEK